VKLPFSSPYLNAICSLCLLIGLPGCGGGGGGGGDSGSTPSAPPSTYTIGGTVTGLSGGNTLVLRLNGGETKTLSAPGAFSFSTALAAGANFSVSVATQPTDQICSVTNGVGTIGSAAISTVAVTCASGQLDPNAPTVLSTTHKPTLVGVVIDSKVINLNYSAVALSGATNLSGEFNYQPGDLITFKVGDIALPQVVGQPVIFVSQFGNASDPTKSNNTIFNIAWFLQSLDQDGDVSNGITVSQQAHTAALGKTLDFSKDQTLFYNDANPIVAASGGANTGLIASNLVLPNIAAGAATLNAFKVSAVAGSWTTGSGSALQAIVFFDNKTYYQLTATCGGFGPSYEFGSYAFDANSNQLTTTVIEDSSSACGLGNAATAVNIGNSTLTLNGATWQTLLPLSSGGTPLVGGPYVNGNLAQPSTSRIWLFTAAEYILLDNCSNVAYVESGSYTWNSSTHAFAATVAHTTDTNCNLSHDNTATADGQTLTLGTIAGGNDGDISIYLPGLEGALLVGAWDFGDPINGGADLFTADGRIFVTHTCSSSGSTSSRESGTYIWDISNSNASMNITQDGDGNCGEADLANGRNAGLVSAKINGNIADFTFGNQLWSVARIAGTAKNYEGTWQNTTTPSLVIGVFNTSNATTISQQILAIGSDCSITSADELFDFLFTPSTNTVSAVVPSGDTLGCGLPATFGPNFSVTGDTLSTHQD